LKAQTFILTTCATFALVAPAAHAAGTANRLYQTSAEITRFDAPTRATVSTSDKLFEDRLRTIIFDSSYSTTGKSPVAKRSKVVAPKQIGHTRALQ
jgi:hypothetical protein